MLSVVARPRRLGPGAVMRDGPGALSAGSPPNWIARLEDDVVTARWLSAVFPAIGLALGALGFALTLVRVTWPPGGPRATRSPSRLGPAPRSGG